MIFNQLKLADGRGQQLSDSVGVHGQVKGWQGRNDSKHIIGGGNTANSFDVRLFGG